MPRNVDVSKVQIFFFSDCGYRNTTRVATQSTSWQLDTELWQQWTTLTPETANTSSLPVIRQQEEYSTWTLWISGNFWFQLSTSRSGKWIEDVYPWNFKLSLQRMKEERNEDVYRQNLNSSLRWLWILLYCGMWLSVVWYKDLIVTYRFLKKFVHEKYQ
jgi:hypothetical protein